MRSSFDIVQILASQAGPEAFIPACLPLPFIS